MMIRERAEALSTAPAPLTIPRTRIAEMAAKRRLPVVYHESQFVDDGGLMSYGPNVVDMFRRAAYFVDRILKGAKPADLPVEQPMKFERVINLKTTKQIGVSILSPCCTGADKVIKRGSTMAVPYKRPVTLEELLVSSLTQTDALANLLIDKGLITREAFMEKISEERATYQRTLHKVK